MDKLRAPVDEATINMAIKDELVNNMVARYVGIHLCYELEQIGILNGWINYS